MARQTGDNHHILLVGAGKMGGALVDAWLTRKIIQSSNIVLIEPDIARAKHFRETYSLQTFETLEAVNTGVGQPIVVFAIKPQVMDAVVPLYRGLAQQGSLILSIAAGKTLDYFEGILGANSPIVRAMPNTPASIGKGMTALCSNDHVNSKQKTLCQELVSAVGKVRWVDNEQLMDPVTAVSGSGPAYVFLLIEVLAEAGFKAGLDQDLANELAVTTVAGAAALAEESTLSPSILRQNVTSPGGTTEAALTVLMSNDRLSDLFLQAVNKAVTRSRELAG